MAFVYLSSDRPPGIEVYCVVTIDIIVVKDQIQCISFNCYVCFGFFLCSSLAIINDGQINIVCKQNAFILLAYNRETEFYSTQGSVL